MFAYRRAVVQARGMPNIPTPIRAALGLAATAVDEARKLPETLPQAVTTVPLMAVSSAMQASLKVQQHIAMLAARGDEVLSQLRGSSAEPPSWATFDDDSAGGENGQPAKAAFDLIDYDNTGYAEGAEDEGSGRWDAVGVGGSAPEGALGTSLDAGGLTSDLGMAGDETDVTATPPDAAGPTPPPSGLAEAVSAPDQPSASPSKAGRPTSARARAGAAKAGPAKAGAAKAGPAKAGPAKSTLAKATPASAGSARAVAKAGPVKGTLAKAGPARSTLAKATPEKATSEKAGPVKAAPAKATKRASRKVPDHEPLEVAAKKAKPSATPNPSTMAAEIAHAHEAATDDE